MDQVTEIRIPLSEIQPNDELLRPVDRASEEYQDFAASIKSRGVLQPILIRPIPVGKQVPGGAKYKIIEGNHRWTASLDAGLKDIPVRIVQMSDAEVADSQIIANIQRIETKPKEYAEALARKLQREPMLTKAELANQINKSTSTLERILSLTALDDEVGELVDGGQITLQNATILAKLKDPEDQKLFMADATSKDAATLGAAVQAHLREKNKARREGRPAGPVEYQPDPRLLKIADIQMAYANPDNVTALLKAWGVKVNPDTVLAATTALQYCVSMDPPSILLRKEQHEKDKVERERIAALKKEEKAKAQQEENAANRARLEQELAVL